MTKKMKFPTNFISISGTNTFYLLHCSESVQSYVLQYAYVINDEYTQSIHVQHI